MYCTATTQPAAPAGVYRRRGPQSSSDLADLIDLITISSIKRLIWILLINQSSDYHQSNRKLTVAEPGSKRTLITAIECISAAGNSLNPLVIWPSATHRSHWTTHPTPGWHFACTESGYTNNAINMHWIQHVFDPLTKATANGKPRILISDGLASHESLDVMTFCYENNIILCRLPSHTSHKLQPCSGR
jgi:hypothetical protein